ncbi:hypothetical protein VKT23_014758 [Stygiomarasmius scandens]|uniref:Uncharacterized protein n=1 Tax=Marasmiellus scandens TaxID=2682957 RepID=A0ABR1IZY3_9AGAR
MPRGLHKLQPRGLSWMYWQTRWSLVYYRMTRFRRGVAGGDGNDGGWCFKADVPLWGVHAFCALRGASTNMSNYSAFFDHSPLYPLRLLFDMLHLLLVYDTTLSFAWNAHPPSPFYSLHAPSSMPRGLHKLLFRATSKLIMDALTNSVVACLLSDDKFSEGVFLAVMVTMGLWERCSDSMRILSPLIAFLADL